MNCGDKATLSSQYTENDHKEIEIQRLLHNIKSTKVSLLAVPQITVYPIRSPVSLAPSDHCFNSTSYLLTNLHMTKLLASFHARYILDEFVADIRWPNGISNKHSQ